MSEKNKRNQPHIKPMVFGSFNYKLLVLGLVLVCAGFTAMYIENKVTGFISLFISPIVILAGYVAVIFSIMMRPVDNRPAEGRGVN